MKHKVLIVQSLVLIAALSGCGGTSSDISVLDSDEESISQNTQKLSPVIYQSLAPDQMPNLETQKKSKSNRAFISLKSDKHNYEKGDSAVVTISDMPQRYDWVGLFHKGDASERDNLLTYVWTDDIKKGDIKIKLQNNLKRHDIEGLPDGEYEIRAFTAGGAYKELAKISVDISSADNNQNGNSFGDHISLDPTYKAVVIKDISSLNCAWIGLFPKGSDNDYDNVIDWVWIDDIQNDTLTLWQVASGEYDLRLFSNDTDMVASVPLTINWNATSNTKLSLYQRSFSTDDEIVVHFEDMPGTDNQWIGIYEKGAPDGWQSAIDIAWPDYTLNGDVTFSPLDEGDYEIRVYYGNDNKVKAKTYISVVSAEDSSKKVLLFADEHDPHNRLLAVDYENMELVDEVYVKGSKTHHADVVGDVDSAEYILMIPKGSRFINVYTVKEREFVKRIDLPFNPRSADAYNKSKNMVLLTSSNRPAAVLIDANSWSIVATAGMNISCELKFNDYNYLPWYYKRVVYKKRPITDISCNAPDFGGQQISGHPAWLDSDHFVILDRANRLIHLYKLTYSKYGKKWNTKLTDVIPTSTSLHQLIPSGHNDGIFYGMSEGNGNGEGIAPVIYKWKFSNGKLKELNKVSLITTKTIDMMKENGTYDSYNNFWSRYKDIKSYYKYYYPTNFSNRYNKYYPGSYDKYYSDYYSNYRSYYNSKIKDYSSYCNKHVPTQIQQQFKSLGGHNLYISPAVNKKEYLWGAVASGQTFVVNTDSMKVTSVVKSDQGAGHVNFQQNGDYAVITNHQSANVTIANYKTQKFVTNVKLPYEKENIFSALQSHSPYITRDDNYFHNSWTDGGVFFRIDLNTLKLDDNSLYTGGIPIQGNYYPHYQGD